MLLEIEDLVKEFPNGVRANDGISLCVERGQIFGLLGPNGAGKTTLVDQVIALLKPTSGAITLAGTDIVKSPGFARQACSFQPQNSVPIDGFTPAEAIELIGQLRGGRKAAVQKRARELVESLDIVDWATKPGQQLSGGIRRLVGYCMAAVAPGEIVILDEPTNDVDPLRRRLLWREIRSLADSGTAVLLITHNVLEAERAVDKLAVIDKGRVVGIGTPAALKGAEAGRMRLDIKLVTEEMAPVAPDFLTPHMAGRRLQATLEDISVAPAIAWANALRKQNIAEEYSLAPASLEDVYVRMIGREEARGA